MKNSSIFAKYISENKIRITVLSQISRPTNAAIVLIRNDQDSVGLKIDKVSKMNNLAIFDCSSPFTLELGNKYLIYVEPYGICSLDMSDAPFDENFDDKYFYNGSDLGANYTKEQTTFVLWAPVASNALLRISTDGGKNFVYHNMVRELKGVFRLTLQGDYDGAIYNYIVENSGIIRTTTDPYAKASTANGKNSVVIDFNKVQIDLENDVPPVTKRYTDAIIYELHVRDFTINKNTNIVNKGKFLGLAEEGRTTTKGNPAGLDYLKYLGVTHVQLLPIYDYKTVDEEFPDTKYNWGYDPQQYFCPEGSFATNANDGYSRVRELKQMVKTLHHNKIKVIMDVVYNHMYDFATTSLEAVVPNYYFRRNPNGTLSNGSFCGDDLATERKMVSKFIVDSCLFWIKEYGIDGFRFDLMGIIDKITLMKIYKEAIKIKPDFMIYGEGWNMPTALLDEQKSSMYNAFQLPKIGFFNDGFRDILKGPTGESDFHVGGYLTGDLSYVDGFKFAFCGGTLPIVFNPKFPKISQSINYVECHDNGTLYDKICACMYLTNNKEIFKIIKEINACVLFSYGVPFIHMGQEIGLSKNMHQNTYNSGDKYNQMRYDLLDERMDMANYLKSAIEARKDFEFLKEDSTEAVSKNTSFENLENGGLLIKIKDVKFKDDKKGDFLLLINPSNNEIYYDFNEDVEFVFGNNGYFEDSKTYAQRVSVSPHNLDIYRKIK